VQPLLKTLQRKAELDKDAPTVNRHFYGEIRMREFDDDRRRNRMAVWGSGSRDPVKATPGCWYSHLLRSNEGEDLAEKVDSKDAGSGSGGNVLEIA
jgi:hypothetical protein